MINNRIQGGHIEANIASSLISERALNVLRSPVCIERLLRPDALAMASSCLRMYITGLLEMDFLQNTLLNHGLT
jgi:hypothetical protein